jgi:hypothetical protein
VVHTPTHDESSPGRTTFNWVFGAATVPAAIGIVAVVYMKILSTAGCTTPTCPTLSETAFTVIQFGVPAVAILTVIASFFTASKRRGVLVPFIAWVLLVTAAVIVFLGFQ